MKLIIDIPNNVYSDYRYQIQHGLDNPVKKYIANGTPYEERPQGEWKVYGKQGGIPITDICSNCRYEMKWYKNKYNFCPQCGADMRKGGAK